MPRSSPAGAPHLQAGGGGSGGGGGVAGGEGEAGREEAAVVDVLVGVARMEGGDYPLGPLREERPSSLASPSGTAAAALLCTPLQRLVVGVGWEAVCSGVFV